MFYLFKSIIWSNFIDSLLSDWFAKTTTRRNWEKKNLFSISNDFCFLIFTFFYLFYFSSCLKNNLSISRITRFKAFTIRSKRFIWTKNTKMFSNTSKFLNWTKKIWFIALTRTYSNQLVEHLINVLLTFKNRFFLIIYVD